MPKGQNGGNRLSVELLDHFDRLSSKVCVVICIRFSHLPQFIQTGASCSDA